MVRALDSPASSEELGRRLDLDPALVDDLLGVLVALGAIERQGERYAVTPAFEPFRSGSLARVLRAGVRSDHLQTAEAFRRARDGSLAPGWAHRDPDLLVSQGETAGLFRLAAEHILPSLEGLCERLEEPGARFLDVGAGVGVLSTELCMVYPEVSAVCLEPNATARGIGRERLLEAGLEDRVEFVSHGVEELEPCAGYDLALIPQPFLAPAAFSNGLTHVREALRPGGWLLVLALDLPAEEPIVAASRRVRARLWVVVRSSRRSFSGGSAKPASRAVRHIRRSGPIGCMRRGGRWSHPPVPWGWPT